MTSKHSPREDQLQEQNEALRGRIDAQSTQLAAHADTAAASAEVFRLIVDSVRDYAIFMLDPTGRVATWNSGAEAIKGYTAAEIIGTHFSVFYPPEDVEAGKCERELEVAQREGRVEDTGWRVRKDGTRFWGSVVISAVRDRTGALIGFSKVTRDLTQQRKADDQRRAMEERFRLIIESVRDYAIFALDPNGNVATWNAGAQRIKGYTAPEIVGSHFSRFYPPADVKAGKCEWELEVAGREGRFEDEGWRVRKDGSRFWANVVISAVRDDRGTLVGFSKVTRDLTDRKRVEEERAARLAAEHASRSKDEFLAMLGHELRNPLAPIVTALELIQMRGDGGALTKEHQVIERQVGHMMRLVDDLLDVSRIARGKIELKRRRVDLREVVAKALEMAAPLMEQRKHHVAVDQPSEAVVVNGDEGRLTQVVSNLLTNSARYTPPGGNVIVTLRSDDDEARLSVKDDGQGIDAALLPNLFDMFVQGVQTSERSSGGLGLGLTIVKSLVEQHGGRVIAESAGRGHGSTFSVYLPLDDTAQAASSRASNPRLPRATTAKKILVVDDNEDARTLLCEVLQAAGHEVRSAGDAFVALDHLRSFRPDVAILDLGLPVVDGYELAAKLRERLGAAMPRLIALSGYAQPNDRTKSAAAGFDVHLVKPVDGAKLLGELGD